MLKSGLRVSILSISVKPTLLRDGLFVFMKFYLYQIEKKELDRDLILKRTNLLNSHLAETVVQIHYSNYLKFEKQMENYNKFIS